VERCTSPQLRHPRGYFPGGPLVTALVEKEGGGGGGNPPSLGGIFVEKGFPHFGGKGGKM